MAFDWAATSEWLRILLPAVAAVFGGLVTWFIRNRVEELRSAQQRLHSERRKIYAELLDPYIRIFSSVKTGAGAEDATKKILSYEYRKTAFELVLVGSDDVVRAFNNMMQFSFRGENNPKTMLLLWGNLLLEIRKSLGNERTKLTPEDTLRFMISDIDKLMNLPDK